MNKLLLSAISIVVLSSCVHKNMFGYTHKKYGEGNKDNPVFVRDLDECNKAVYANGVLIDGVQVTDQPTIDKFQKEYSEVLINNFREALKQNSGAAAYAGATAATAVTTGNTSNINYKPKTTEMAKPPERYNDLERLRGEASNCLVSKGWKSN